MLDNEDHDETVRSAASTCAMTPGSDANQGEATMPYNLSSETGPKIDSSNSSSQPNSLEHGHLKSITVESMKATRDHLSIKRKGAISSGSFGEGGNIDTPNLYARQGPKSRDSGNSSHPNTFNGNEEMKNAALEAKNTSRNQAPLHYRPETTQQQSVRIRESHLTSAEKLQRNGNNQAQSISASSHKDTEIATKNNTSPPNSISEFPDGISPQAIANFPIEDDSGTTESEDDDENDSGTQRTTELSDSKSAHERIALKSACQVESSGKERQNVRIDAFTKETKTSEHDDLVDLVSTERLSISTSTKGISQLEPPDFSSLKKDIKCDDNNIENTVRNIPKCTDSGTKNELENNKGNSSLIESSSTDEVIRSRINDSIPPSKLSVASYHVVRTTDEIARRANNDATHLPMVDLNAEERRSRNEAASLDKLKIILYMEAMKVHKGKGGDRLFADYWDALGRYLSKGDSARSDDDPATNGVEAVLTSFLTTGKLRKLHNSYVKMLMKQCLQVRVLRDRIRDHIPLNWKYQVTNVSNKRNHNGEFKSSMIDVDGLALLREDFGINSAAFGNSGSQPIKLEPCQSEWEDYHDSIQSPSPRLPGTLEIDHISRYITEKDGYCLSQSAQWLAVISVRDYLKNILQKTMDYSASKDTTKGEFSKRRRISGFDFIQVIDGSVLNTAAENNISLTNSRIAWEHFTSNSCNAIQSGSHQELNSIQTTINSMFSEGTFDGGNDQSSRRNTSLEPESIANGENRNGQGKDFSAMKVRKSNAMTPPPTLTASELNLKNALNGQEAPGFSQLGEMSNAMNLTRSGLSSFQNSLDQLRGSSEQNANAVFRSTDTVPAAAPLPEINIALFRPNSSMAYRPQKGNGGSIPAPNASEPTRTSSAGSNASATVNVPSSASSSNTNSGGGRGKGSKDLQAMFARRN